MKYGLSVEIVASMQAVFAKHPKIEKVILYGSRAKGTQHKGSDIDLTLVGELELTDLYAVDEELDKLNLPYMIDLSLYGQIDNEGLIGHIERWGIVFYLKSTVWEIKKLCDFCTVIAGQSPEGKFYNSIGNGLPFYQGKKEFGSKFIGSPTKWTSKTTKEAISGDILMSVRAPVGPINFAIQKICIGRGLAAIRASEKIDKEFLFYYLLSKQDEIKGNEGAVFASINKSQIEQLRFSYVNINEQKRIVDILDLTFADIEKARANAEQNLKNARELFESYLQQVFSQRGDGWMCDHLDNLFKIKHGYAFKSKDFETDFKGDNPIVLTPGNYTEYGDLYFTVKNTKRCISDFPKDFLFENRDLTIVMTDLSSQMKILGKPAFIDSDNILHNQRIGKFEFLTKKVEKEYLYYFLLSGLSLKNIHSTATGTTVRHTAPSRILNNEIPFPRTIEKQLKIIESLEHVNRKSKQLEKIYRAKISELDELKKSILQKAFTGELTKEKVA